ncbi:MAG: T9SS type A sorting domain-containing protein [Bacteroidetes bacterium]|nr:T9SS type A sorting domain-containing protein [Bacteroidota bacterium]
MRQFILLFFAFFISYNAFTQCTPDASLTHSGLFPNILPDGKVGVAYNQTITFQFPSDTTISPFGSVHIDSIIIQSVTGFPASFTKDCNAVACKYYGTSLRGCMKIAGTPTTADTGTKKLVIIIIAKLKLAGQPVPFPVTDSSLSFKVLSSGVGLSRGQAQTYSFGIEQITPNPFTDKTVVSLTTSKTEKATLAIRDILGKEVYNHEVACKPGLNNFTIDTESFKAGYYLLSVISPSGVITKKITKR